MQQRNSRTTRDMTILGGWLFADLLLALAVIFMAAQPSFPKAFEPTPTPTATAIATATPSILAKLDPQKHRFIVQVDKTKFLANDPAAVNSVKQQILGQAFLQGRSAGLIVAFGYANSNCQDEQAYTVATDVYNLVNQLGKSDQTFKNVIDYDPLCNLAANVNLITVDIFLFAQA